MWRVADLLGQDEDLHYEYTAEYEAGTGYIVLESWQCCGSVLLRENMAKENWLQSCDLTATKYAKAELTLTMHNIKIYQVSV